MEQSTAEPFHLGITPEHIVDAAVRLTRESNLFGWSIRDLARALGVTPSVIYHHVGGKDVLARGVAERAIASIPLPDPEAAWQEWFRELLVDSIYPIAVANPGIAKWVLMHGVPFPAVTGIFEVGIAKLQEAGAGDASMMAYSAILNNATLTISLGDERLLHEDDGPRDHAAMMEEFRAAFTEGSAVAALGAEFIAEFEKGGDAAARMRQQYYRYVVEVTLSGVAELIGRGSPGR